jgi:PIN domain nuclease of toxin-antitoxin system
MRRRLDTHIALWAMTTSPRLSAHAQSLILRADEVHFSVVATLWAIAIKHALARSDMPVSAALPLQAFESARYEVLNVAPAHVLAV